ncbi:glutamate--tRNA ligase [Eubacterium maltosivorans]|uniref:Glutamate--tRNA ligase n=1 Tax=Eubacterium maltosivorans TaxID=2041044 RepID=A0A4P9CEH4_EUBML|nr:glutamate--tRNA ligase [Eubacterium maltosivorans]QCT73331.1 glutamate--tRNA ligase [Eubacterium maltosivorans]
MIRDRFAPSPTGNVHVGSLRTALYNYLFAKKNNGQFLLRLEDTDRTRYEEGAVENLLNALMVTGVVPDEGLFEEDGKIVQRGDCGPYIQSERLDIYKKYIDQLLENGQAYYCFCTKERLDEVREKQKAAGETPRYDGHCRNLPKEEVEARVAAGEPYVIRLKLPEDHVVAFDDAVRGRIEINTNDLDDQVLIKTDGFPTYHFAVVIDDHLMGITHVIRGEEWLPSTPKHVYLYECFGWEQPQYVHLSNILNDDHKKLSKRQGDVSVGDFLKKGYLPEALINFLALLGWSPENEQEIFSMDELIEVFDLSRINKSGAVFDRAKLDWMNAHYIKELPIEELTARMIPYLLNAGYITESDVEKRMPWLEKVGELMRERLNYFAQVPEETKMLFDRNFEITDSESLDILKEETVPVLFNALVEKITESDVVDTERAKAILKEIQKEHKAEKIKGKMLYMPTRIMLTGEMHGPDLTLIMDVLGKEELLLRLDRMRSMIH